jgi:mannose-1-phosphate guanylyltransferase
MYVVILAGGSGTRFWPLSRNRTPKQLMSVFGGTSMLQRTVDRVLPLKPKRILVITNALQAEETARQLSSVRKVPVDIISEPVGRNTAPAIGLAAQIIAHYDPSGTMLVLPADHYIRDEEAFRAVIDKGCESARHGYLVTLGIEPTRPETGYGYIEADTALRGDGPYPVKRFVEKPNAAKALEFLAAGNFFWNSGMFIWQASVILQELKDKMPALAAELAKLTISPDVWELADLNPQIETIYATISSESIDFGVMEKAEHVMVVPADFGWSDVGSWSALPEVIDAGEEGHVAINAKEVVSIDARNCLVYGDGRLVSLVGVEGLIVVTTPDAVMVCPSSRAQDVKKVVEALQQRGLSEYL